MAITLIPTGGGWYVDPDGNKIQLSRKALMEGEYLVEETAKSPAPAAPVSTDEPKPAAKKKKKKKVAEHTETSALREYTEPTKVARSPRSQESWGPFDDYEFITTRYGEYALPAGQVLHFEDNEKGVPMPVYTGRQLTRSQEERKRIRDEKIKAGQA